MTLIENGSAFRPAIGPDGQRLTIADLPAIDTVRWVPKRKAVLVACVRGGLITVDQACERYNLSHEEYNSWTSLIDVHGVKGLKATKRYAPVDQPEAKKPEWTDPAKTAREKMINLKDYLRTGRTGTSGASL